MSLLEEFVVWENKVRPELEVVSELLASKLSDEPEQLIGDLQEIEAWNARMGGLLAQANSWLDRYKLIAMPSKIDGLVNRSEGDRKVILDSEVSPITLVRDTLEHFCDSIKQRLILGESILSYHKQAYQEHRRKEIEKVF